MKAMTKIGTVGIRPMVAIDAMKAISQPKNIAAATQDRPRVEMIGVGLEIHVDLLLDLLRRRPGLSDVSHVLRLAEHVVEQRDRQHRAPPPNRRSSARSCALKFQVAASLSM